MLDGVPSVWRSLVGMLLLLAKRRVAVCWGRVRAQRRDDWLRDAAFSQEQLFPLEAAVRIAGVPDARLPLVGAAAWACDWGSGDSGPDRVPPRRGAEALAGLAVAVGPQRSRAEGGAAAKVGAVWSGPSGLEWAPAPFEEA
ncbi:hypothetical protein NDU88_006490 [Pleurodeles waltl]|uniref:Uncharacterized protein n=1 Tax=Pleurodeles waltl TaxID=8319 RepID=A0AAV7TDJ3_PLEWA|nr:hypothetical protein NDU88_006490 [Pleurodeles waltl]